MEKNIPSEFRLDIAVSATESSLKLGFNGRPLFVTSGMERTLEILSFIQRGKKTV